MADDHARPPGGGLALVGLIEAFRGDGRLEEIYSLTWEDGPHPLFQLDTEFGLVGVMHPGVGSPMAVGMLEAAIVCGCRYFVACGGAGALRPGLALGHVIVPSRAIRDEGTSFHYMEPSREVELEQADHQQKGQSGRRPTANRWGLAPSSS